MVSDEIERLYADRDPRKLEPYYCRHIAAMTAEGLHAKHAIAEELAFRDQRIASLQAERDELRDAILHYEQARAITMRERDVACSDRDAALARV